VKSGTRGRDSIEGRKELASRVAQAIVDCDPSILSLLVVDKEGQPLALGRSERLSEQDYFEDGLLPKMGVIAKVIMGAANQPSSTLGKVDFLIGVFGKEKIILYDVPEHKMLLVLRMSRAPKAEFVCKRIAEILPGVE
jgi:hypothetical protein